VRLRHLSLVAILGFIANPLAAQLRLEPFDIRVPSAPAAFPADGKTNFTYELRITNIDRREVKITGIEVIADSTGPSLQSLDSTALKAATRLAGAPVTGGDSRTLPSGRQTLLYLWVTLPEGGSTPSRLRHRISYATVDSANNPVNDVVEAFYVPVRNLTLATIVAPFGGGGGPWVAVNGPSNTSGHRRTAVPIGGEAQIGQRFATDWIKLGPDGLAFKGDSLVNANWYGYGTAVVAVADGIVTETKDGIIENVPFSPKMAVPITLETVGGNHVILDVGGGYYAFYAHLVPGSVKVKVGDRVKKGQQVGLLGNSGNSTAPHLHFHMGDKTSPLGSEGLPFLWDKFELLDWPKSGFGEMLKGWKASAPAVEHRKEVILENMIVSFPK
jgi:hypothetical protein